ncbi:MAG: IclR family transcriptional regulator [Candidatus Rokubacteria bacterium]|nr:IclR family transcriptional regulator [Candidatus Rokubacteria bacterium]
MTPVKILDKTVRLLSVFCAAHPEWSLTELSATVSMPKSTVHRILRVLRQHDYLSQDAGTGRFRLGFAALDLGFRAQAGLDVRRAAAPVLQRLAATSGETVLLIMPTETRTAAICVDRAETRAGLQLILEIGRHVPLHAGASSKVLLAYMTEREIEQVIVRGLERVGPRTITNPLALRRDLAAIRRRGYAWSVEETNEDVAGIAVPLLDRNGSIAAGVSIVGPRTRFTPQRVPALLALIRDGAAEIARQSGLTTLPDTAANGRVAVKRRAPRAGAHTSGR